HGERGSYRIARTVTRNRRRFTYEEVLAILDEADRREPPSGERAAYPRDRRGAGASAPASLPPDAGAYLPLLSRFAALRDDLWRRRQARGALDLDIPRLRLRTDSAGRVVSLHRDER